MKLNEVYFAKEGEKGLNETSASHLCALASQIESNNEKALQNVCFVTTTMNVVGSSGADMIVEQGINEEGLKQIPMSLAGVARMHAFIAWFAEARKNLEDYKKERMRVNLYQWAEENGVTIPERPEYVSKVKTTTLEDVIAMMNIKERQTYLALEAEASTLGKFIHPDRPMEEAREKMHDVVSKPYTRTGSGRDTLIYHRVPSVDVKDVDKQFNQLQHQYRSIEQSLNHMKSDLRKKLAAINLEENNARKVENEDYSAEVNAYQKKMRTLTIMHNQWLSDEAERLSKIKFAIPEAFADTVAFLNNVDKEKSGK